MRKRTTMLLLIYFLLAGWNGFPVARADDPGDKDTLDEDPDTQEVPLDTGLVFLLATGVVYGLKKYKADIEPKK